MSRPKPSVLVLFALGSAAGFLLIRLLYRVIFGGAQGEGELLFSVPRLRLGGVFSHIVIGGDVTTGGVWHSLSSGFPFAAVIALTGLVLAWWDPRSLVFLLPKLRAGRALITASVIAIATLPFLVSVIRDTTQAALWRRVSLGRRVVLPVLEKTLEHAVGIQTALHSRGMTTTSTAADTPKGMVLEEFSWPTRGLRNVSLAIAPGSLTVLTGPTGSGKTSLLEALAGLHPDISPGLVNSVAYLPHRPQNLFLTRSVEEDVALSFVLAGDSRAEASIKAKRLLDQWGLGHLSQAAPSELSAGEAVMVACVVLIARAPALLLLDEPLHSLDAQSRRELARQLHTLAGSGMAVVMTDHRSKELEDIDAEFYSLSPEGLVTGRYVPPPSLSPAMIPRPRPEPDVVARFEDLVAAFGERTVFDGLTVELRRGLATVISGDNGVGKTTLLRLIAKQSAEPGGDVAYVPSEPSDLFFTDTVATELTLADKAAAAAPGLTRLTLESILSGPWRKTIVEEMAHTHPRDLSRGQQMALAIAIQMSHKPLVLALDEPTAGLDATAVETLMAVLECAMETGVSLLIATQELDTCASLPGERLVLSAGVLQPASGVTA
jgi:energy-coupling factor transporter ATP-binding protein EcfA2